MLPFDPKKPLFGFTARFPHAKRRIHLFADEQFIYFRPKNAPENWWGALINASGHWLLSNNPAKEEKYFRQQLESGHFFRVLFLTDPRSTETRWIVQWRPEIGDISLFKEPLLQAFFFPRPAPRSFNNLWRLPYENLANHFNSEWDDSPSDVRTALAYPKLPYPIKSLVGCGMTEETAHDLVHFLRIALINNCSFTENVESIQAITVIQSSNLGIAIFSMSFDANESVRLAPSKRFDDLLNRATKSVFKLQVLPLGARDSWCYSWEERCPFEGNPDQVSFGFGVEPPTQHERLEAALFLRDWLEQNAPDLLSDWFPGVAH